MSKQEEIRFKKMLGPGISLLLLICLSISGYAQGWEKTYGGTANEVARDLLQTDDDGFLLLGNSNSFSSSDRDIYLIKTDVNGQLDWSQSPAVANSDEFGNSLLQTDDGGYLIGGTQIIDTLSYMYLLRTNALGESLWSVRTVEDSLQGRALCLLPDGGAALAGVQQSYVADGNGNLLFEGDFFVWRTDANGNTQWAKNYGGTAYDEAFDILSLTDGSLLVLGNSQSFGAGGFDIWLLKLDADGEEVWSNTYGGPFADLGYDLSPTTDGGFIIAGRKNDASTIDDDLLLLKVDAEGVEEWMQVITKPACQTAWSVQETATGEYIILGEEQSACNGIRDVLLVKTDAAGNELWSQRYGGLADDSGNAVQTIATGGYALAGYTRSFGAGGADAYLIRTDSEGTSLSNYILGNVFTDFNNNCLKDSAEIGIQNWIVGAERTDTYYGTTDSLGNYSILADSGNYLLHLATPHPYWTLCEDSIPITLAGVYDTVQQDFALQPLVDCPLLVTDIATPFLRRCASNTYTVSYYNTGTAIAENARLDILFDDYLRVDSSSLPWTTQSGQLYSFDLGDLDLFEEGRFKVYTYLNCDSTITGQTHCVEAHIFPDSLCLPLDSLWDGSSVAIEALCNADSLRLTVTNTTSSGMSQGADFVIIEDQLMLMSGQIQLNAFADTSFIVYPEGRTIRMEVAQSSGHPGLSQPSVAVEGCGGPPPGQGYINQFPLNDADPFIEIDCQESIASYDPNDKQAFPTGYGYENYIRANTDIEYLIRFQNTGTDTAFRVVLRDTLSEWLNPASIRLGTSSHPYRFELGSGGVLQFTFDQILLPDSSSNEPASHGFVKFRIAQQRDNPQGTVIYNRAAIYFDFNEAVLTNETLHTIGENFIELEVHTNEQEKRGSNIRVYPNPFQEQTTIEWAESTTEQATFRLYDSSGRLIRETAIKGSTYLFKRRNLCSGFYLFQIEQEGRLLATGKMILL